MLGQNKFASCRFSHGQIDEPRFVPVPVAGIALKLISPFTPAVLLPFSAAVLCNYFSRDVGGIITFITTHTNLNLKLA